MKPNKKQLKQSLRIKNDLYRIYKEAFSASLTEIKFLKKQVEMLLSEMDAIGALVDDKLVKLLIENVKERKVIDGFILGRTLFNEETLKGFKK